MGDVRVVVIRAVDEATHPQRGLEGRLEIRAGGVPQVARLGVRRSPIGRATHLPGRRAYSLNTSFLRLDAMPM